MEDNRLREGWKEFVMTHDFGIGDFLIFKHEGDLLFHVTAFGPRFCEIRYEPSSKETETSSRSDKEAGNNVNPESNHSSHDLKCLSLPVTASNLKTDIVTVPIDFAKLNGLMQERQETVLMNEEGKSWAAELKPWRSLRVSIIHGWTTFCTENKLVAGDSCTFRLLQNTEKHVFQLCNRAKDEGKKKIWSGEDYNQSRENRFVKLTPTVSSLKMGKQHLPVSFMRANELINPGMITLVDKNGAEWAMKLNVDGRNGMMHVYDWKCFCAANEVRARESLTLELIRGGTSPVLKFCSMMEKPPFEAEAHAHKRARVEQCTRENKRKVEIREKTVAEGEPSRCTQTSNKSSANEGNLQHTRPKCVSDEVAKVKQIVMDTFNSIKLFQAELETMNLKLEDSFQELNNLEKGKGNGNNTTP